MERPLLTRWVPTTAMQIYVRQVSGGRPLALTSDSTDNFRWPRWSPDGSRIAYQSNDGIYIVPSLGGAPAAGDARRRRNAPIRDRDGHADRRTRLVARRHANHLERRNEQRWPGGENAFHRRYRRVPDTSRRGARPGLVTRRPSRRGVDRESRLHLRVGLLRKRRRILGVDRAPRWLAGDAGHVGQRDERVAAVVARWSRPVLGVGPGRKP